MTTYTFLSASGREVTVEAINEEMARHRAMVALWGPYPHTYGKTAVQEVAPLNGMGLILKARKDG